MLKLEPREAQRIVIAPEPTRGKRRTQLLKDAHATMQAWRHYGGGMPEMSVDQLGRRLRGRSSRRRQGFRAATTSARCIGTSLAAWSSKVDCCRTKSNRIRHSGLKMAAAGRD